MAIGDSLANPFLWVDDDYAVSSLISGGATQYYAVPLRKGTECIFFVSNTGGMFDAFLTLYDTLDNSQAVLASDDNSLDGISEPQIAGFIVPVTGIYYLGVSTLDYDGTFDLVMFPTGVYFRSKGINIFNSIEYIKRSLLVNNKISDFRQNKKILINNTFNSYTFRFSKINNTFNAFDVHITQQSNVFNSKAITKSVVGGRKYNSWVHSGYEIFTNGLLIGVLAEGQTTIADVALVDGTYEIEVRPVGNFYREVFVSQTFKVTLDSITGVSILLPDILNLTTKIISTRTHIGFTINPPISQDALKIGLWFSTSSGIDISGTPDVILSAAVLLNFNYSFKQVVSQWVAVAFFDGARRGSKEEIELVWSTTLPDAPEFQHINI